MTGPGTRQPPTPGSTPGSSPGYSEPQPHDGDDARRRGPQPDKDREDGGLQRDPDGDAGASDGK